MTIVERLAALRNEMKRYGVDVYIVPSADFHQSEYVGEYFKAREFISGFTGSAGVVVITADEALLWTDGRYFIQAESELSDSTYKLMKMGEPGVPCVDEYMTQIITKGSTIAFDGRVISVEEGKAYERAARKKGARICYDLNLIDAIWEDRPELSKESVWTLDIKYAGETTASKLARIRMAMSDTGADMHALISLDDICWILNIRGNDIAYFPLVLAYSIITMDRMHLYIDESKLDEELKARLAADNVVLHPYNEIYEDIKCLTENTAILIDPARFNYALYNSIPKTVKKIEAMNPSVVMKASKNAVEIANIRNAELKDSIAHIKFMKWLKESIEISEDDIGKSPITELSAATKLEEFRKEQGNYIGPSFDPISAYGEHAAIIHYAPTEESNVELQEGNFLLTDTGANYYEGSTDITRTYALGEVPDELKKHFTFVAVANLSLANTKFPEGMSGPSLDVVARQPMWNNGLNYRHGTGHGVGYLLSIHEDPIRISCYSKSNTPIMENLVVTDEPGVYIEGSHGIRLENELLCCKGERNENGQFMYFDILTYIPFDLDAIDPSVLTETDKRLLNDYHKKVFDVMSPYLNDEEVEWLKVYTKEIE